MNKLPVSVVINTFNEEKNIRNCLESVKWADEIVIVDMHSDDKTVEIAKKYTEDIYFYERLGYADPARQFALEKATRKWVLSIDADEIVPRRLRDRLLKIVNNDGVDMVYIPLNNYFFGHLMLGTGWGALQTAQPRFFKKGFLKYSQRVHDIFEIKNNPRIYRIKNPREGFIHFNYIDIEHFLEKLNRYTTIEAQNIFNGQKDDFGIIELIAKLLREFIWRFFWMKGYKDGIQGFYLSTLMSTYMISTFSKLSLMKKFNSTIPKEEIAKSYADITCKILDEYKE